MKKISKTTIARMISVCIAVVLMFTAVPTVAAADYLSTPPALTAAAHDDGVAPLVDDTVWYFRDYNGKKQMRLWSKIQAKWLTDWIDLE